MFTLRDFPKYEALQNRAGRYPEIDPAAVEAFLWLLRVGGDVQSGLEKFLSFYKLTLGSFSVLMVLNRDPGLPRMPSELASMCGVTRATITGIIGGLVRKKLVGRDHRGKDKRAVWVKLTRDGIELLDAFGHEYYRRTANLMGGLSVDDKRRFTAMLHSVLSRVDEVSRPVRLADDGPGDKPVPAVTGIRRPSLVK